MAITDFPVDFNGTPDEQDIRGAKRIIRLENERRLTDVDENGDPIDPPLSDVGAELKTNYLYLLGLTVMRAHQSYVNIANTEIIRDPSRVEAYKNATDAVQDQIDTLLGI